MGAPLGSSLSRPGKAGEVFHWRVAWRMEVAHCYRRSVASSPEVLISDKPVSALDQSVRAQLLTLFLDFSRDMNLPCLSIAYELACKASVVHRKGASQNRGEKQSWAACHFVLRQD